MLAQGHAQALVEHLLQPPAGQLVRQRLANRLQIGHEGGTHRHPQHVALRGDRLAGVRGGAMAGRGGDGVDGAGGRGTSRRRWRCRRAALARLGGAGGGEFRPGTTAIIPRIWKLPQQVGRCRLRPKGGHQLLDLILGSPRSAIQDLDEVCLVEHVAQLDQGGEVEPAIGEVVGHEGKTRQQPRGRRATKGRRLGEPKRSVQNENSDGEPGARTVLRRSSSAR